MRQIPGQNCTPQLPVTIASTVASNHWTPGGGNSNTDSLTWNGGAPLTRTSTLQFMLSWSNLLFLPFLRFFFQSRSVYFSPHFCRVSYVMNAFLHKQFNCNKIIYATGKSLVLCHSDLTNELCFFKASSPAVLVEFRSSWICSQSVFCSAEGSF